AVGKKSLRAKYRADEAIALGFDNAAIYNLRGNSRMGCPPNGRVKYEEASSDFTKAIDRDPRMQAARLNRAQAKLRLWQLTQNLDEINQAVTDIEEAIKLGVGSLPLYST